jgi:hypothetical protein
MTSFFTAASGVCALFAATLVAPCQSPIAQNPVGLTTNVIAARPNSHHYAVQPAGQNGLNFPVITGGAETVICCEVTPDQIRVTATDLSGRSLPQLPLIKTRARK